MLKHFILLLVLLAVCLAPANAADSITLTMCPGKTCRSNPSSKFPTSFNVRDIIPITIELRSAGAKPSADITYSITSSCELYTNSKATPASILTLESGFYRAAVASSAFTLDSGAYSYTLQIYLQCSASVSSGFFQPYYIVGDAKAKTNTDTFVYYSVIAVPTFETIDNLLVNSCSTSSYEISDADTDVEYTFDSTNCYAYSDSFCNTKITTITPDDTTFSVYLKCFQTSDEAVISLKAGAATYSSGSFVVYNNPAFSNIGNLEVGKCSTSGYTITDAYSTTAEYSFSSDACTVYSNSGCTTALPQASNINKRNLSLRGEGDLTVYLKCSTTGTATVSISVSGHGSVTSNKFVVYANPVIPTIANLLVGKCSPSSYTITNTYDSKSVSITGDCVAYSDSSCNQQISAASVTGSVTAYLKCPSVSSSAKVSVTVGGYGSADSKSFIVYENPVMSVSNLHVGDCFQKTVSNTYGYSVQYSSANCGVI